MFLLPPLQSLRETLRPPLAHVPKVESAHNQSPDDKKAHILTKLTLLFRHSLLRYDQHLSHCDNPCTVLAIIPYNKAHYSKSTRVELP